MIVVQRFVLGVGSGFGTRIHQTGAGVVWRHRFEKGVCSAFASEGSITRRPRGGCARRIRGIRHVVVVTRRGGKLAQVPVPHFFFESAFAIGGVTIGLTNLGAYHLRDKVEDNIRPHNCEKDLLR